MKRIRPLAARGADVTDSRQSLNIVASGMTNTYNPCAYLRITLVGPQDGCLPLA